MKKWTYLVAAGILLMLRKLRGVRAFSGIDIHCVRIAP